MSRVALDLDPCPLRVHPSIARATPRAVYMMEAISDRPREEWLLKLGISENVKKRQAALARDIRLRLLGRVRVRCVAYSVRGTHAAAESFEASLINECGRRWTRIIGTEWFRWSDEMRAEMRDRLNADRRAFMGEWSSIQAGRSARGEPMQSIGVARGVVLAP